MTSENRPNSRQDLDDSLKKQDGLSLENCNLEFLGYQQGLKGERPTPSLAQRGAYRKGYIEALKYLRQKELAQIPSSGNQPQDFLNKINAIEKDVIPNLDRLIPTQGLSDTRNYELELLGFQAGLANQKAQKELWVNFAYQKGYLIGTNRFWHQQFGSSLE